MDRVNARAQFPFLIYSVPWVTRTRVPVTTLHQRVVRFWPNIYDYIRGEEIRGEEIRSEEIRGKEIRVGQTRHLERWRELDGKAPS